MEDEKIGVCLLVSLKGFFFLFELLSVSGVWTLERQSRVICEVAWSLIFLIDHRCQVVVRVGVVH